ncbi:hypothetical protein PtA15_10A694 [Puccinia triticina]|uniref:Uncharacterized protein n=1 Tax=Puccinia triticina TaxID=208348 RepID=A0ABY7CZQ7_9BASI|nr:uncharacterized protein PtA15_10A694 [Puccinia triticina]WAQ89270.1 hypothetical protein PtA15_10A694 [Puccinia triticina]
MKSNWSSYPPDLLESHKHRQKKKTLKNRARLSPRRVTSMLLSSTSNSLVLLANEAHPKTSGQSHHTSISLMNADRLLLQLFPSNKHTPSSLSPKLPNL